MIYFNKFFLSILVLTSNILVAYSSPLPLSNNSAIDKPESYQSHHESKTVNINDKLFNSYLVKAYKGNIKTPRGYTLKEGMWFDDLGKAVNPIEINFAGQYYIGRHSYGYACRYYTLVDLSKNIDLSRELEDFSYSPDSDQQYFVELLYRPNSQLLIARYFENIESEEYKECLFLLKNNKLINIKNYPTK